tara:strand:+ start:515 stop:1132 length:618 start_codon:yes stop_codon:yes gene_type:complete
MYGGFEVYKTYLAVKLHFTSASYDYIKYEGKINAKLDTFTSRNDRYFFHKLSTRYKQDEILDFFVANFAKDDKKWVKSLLENDGKGNYLEYKKYQNAVGYHFRNDCSLLNDRIGRDMVSFNDVLLVSNGQHPTMLRLLIQRKINIQTAIIIDSILSYSKNWSKDINEKVVWPKIAFKMAKLKGFMKYNETECKLIMKEVFNGTRN